MLKELNEYIIESGDCNDISQYDDTKYIQLPEEHQQQIVNSMNSGEVPMKKASECPAKRLLLHFANTLLFVNSDTVDTDAIYDVYLAQGSNSSDDEMMGYTYTSFSLDNDYQPKLISHSSDDKVDEKQLWGEIHTAMLTLRGFMSAISE
jgi:hypothetical protein